MNIVEYIVPITALATWAICQLIKPWIDDKSKYMPTIAGLLGILFQLWNSGFQLSINTIVIGVVSGLTATGLFEFGKQFKIKEGE